MGSRVLWSAQLDYNLNAVVYGMLFNSKKNEIAVGGEDGMIKVYQSPDCFGFKETKYVNLKVNGALF